MSRGTSPRRSVRAPDPWLYARPVREVRALARPFAPPDFAIERGPRLSAEQQDYLIDAIEQRGYRVVRTLEREEHAPYNALIVTKDDAGVLITLLAALGRGGQSADPRMVTARLALPTRAPRARRAAQRRAAVLRSLRAQVRRAERLAYQETIEEETEETGHPGEAPAPRDDKEKVHAKRNTHAADRDGGAGRD